MNYWQLWNAIKESEEVQTNNYSTRWMLARDLPEVVRMAVKHPQFSGLEEEEIEKQLRSALRNRNCIGMITGPTFKKSVSQIEGAMIYLLNKDHLKAPFMVADNPEAYDSLLEKLKFKTSSHKRVASYIRGHYDMNLLKAFKKHGLNAKPDSDYVTPFHHVNPAVAQSKNWALPNWGEFNKSLNYNYQDKPNVPQPNPDEPSSDDEFGLFKDKPWKD